MLTFSNILVALAGGAIGWLFSGLYLKFHEHRSKQYQTLYVTVHDLKKSDIQSLPPWDQQWLLDDFRRMLRISDGADPCLETALRRNIAMLEDCLKRTEPPQ